MKKKNGGLDKLGQVFSQIWTIWLALLFFIAVILVIMKFKTISWSEMEGTHIQNGLHNPSLIIQAVTVAIAVNSTLVIDLVLDIFYYTERNGLDDRFERAGTILVLIIPGYFILRNEENPDFIQIFCCLHSIQIIGSLIPIFSLSMRLLPEFFTPKLTVLSFVCFASDISLTLYFWTVPSSAWIYVLYLVLAACFQGTLLFMSWKWFRSLCGRCTVNTSGRQLILNLFSLMTPDELQCAVYLLFSNIVIVLITSVIGMHTNFSFTGITATDFLLGIYSLASFSVLSSCVPNRILQHIAIKQDQQIKLNHTTTRYISHEIRSPLNIVQNGIALVRDDIMRGCCISDILDTLDDVQHASCAAISIVDDLLNFEKIENGTFKIDQKPYPAASYFSQVANRCHVLAEHKGIHFSIQNCLAEKCFCSKSRVCMRCER